MKVDSKIGLALLAAFFGTLAMLLGQTTLIQPGQTVIEAVDPRGLVPVEGQAAPRETPPPGQHENISNENSDGSEPNPEPGASQTVYDRDGNTVREKPNAFTKEERGRINYGKRLETTVVKKSSKPAKIEKTKDGSSDASVSTGAFGGSLLDSGLAPRAKTHSAMESIVEPVDIGDAPVPAASVAPKSKKKPAESDSRFGLSLGAGPEASASPSPHSDHSDSGSDH